MSKAEADLAAERIARRQTELDLYVARAAERAAAAKLKEMTSLERSARKELDTLRQYGRDLERKYIGVLDSRTWRLMEPVRQAIRLIKGKRATEPFKPRLVDSSTHKVRRKTAATLLEDKLWGGFSQYALESLEVLKAAETASKAERSTAAWALARWHAAQGDFARSLENVVLMRLADPGKATVLRCQLLEADCLARLGKHSAARGLLNEGLRLRPDHPDIFLAIANSHLHDEDLAGPERDAIRLAWINRIYAGVGLLPLVKRDPEQALTIGNLTSDPGTVLRPEGRPKISVIVPTYCAEATISTALRGLMAQTWNNLEIIVVDDCSTDGMVRAAEAMAEQDARIRVLRQTRNKGSYAARNAGLKQATGDFITTHDADDWSHPQKLELQIRHALEHPEAVANFSDWVRCTADLRVGWLLRAWGGFTGKNMSSVMLRRETFEALGAWDAVRVGGDTDLLRRIEQLFGNAAIARVLPGLPLAFALHEERSLTRQSASHVRTMLYGARREYNEAGEYWRAHTRRPSQLRLPLDPDPARRPFPAPLSVLGRSDERHEVDLLFISDFCLKGGAFVSTLNYVEAARQAGRSVGIFHWRRYDLDVTQPLNPKIRQLAQDREVRIVVPGERVRATKAIVGYPAILTHPVDLFPEIEFEDLVVIVNQMASRLYSGGDAQYDPRVVRENLRTLFGVEGTWVPISGLVHRLMRADPRYPAPSDTIWVPLIETKTWCATPLRWRGRSRRKPVVGRHARDHYTKWPASAAALRDAYCAGKPCTVELMGGAASALDIIESAPANWTIHDFGVMEAADFLQRLDFFVHYPHEDYIEEFGRAVLEALAIGVPVVLPPVFRETFGDAAAYAEPGAVWTQIDALWHDEHAYMEQAKRGRDFVMMHSDWGQMPNRLDS